MYPVLFTIPGLNRDVPGYGAALMVGFLLAILWAARRAERSGGNPDIILNSGFLAIFGGIVGCRLMYVVHYWYEFSGRGGPLEIALAIIDITSGGMEYYGGFILATLLVVGYLVLWRHSLRWYMDIVAPSAALGLAIGRIGCFLNGCCYGGACDLPWALQFPFGSPPQMAQWEGREPGAGVRRELLVIREVGIPIQVTRESLAASDEQIAAAEAAEKSAREAAAQASGKDAVEAKRRLARAEVQYGDLRTQMQRYQLSAAELRQIAAEHRSLPVHPTQLYSTITAGLVALLLNSFYYRRWRDGQVICLLLVIEPVTRVLLEMIRADNPVDIVVGLTISQKIAAGLVALGIAGFLVLQRMPARSPRARLWEPDENAAAARS